MLQSLNRDFAAFETRTQEDIITSFNEVVKRFYQTVEKPLFTYRTFRQGKLPNIKEMNASFTAAGQDLQIIYRELDSIRRRLATNFNALSGMSLNVKSNLSKASSDLLDYKIQNTNRIEPTFYDKFINLSKIETDDNVFDKDKAFVDSKNGRVVMPLSSEAENLEVARIQIVEDSIGVSGNNQEVGAVPRDNLQFVSDSNMDTWFEFEQVSRNEITTPTVLNLKMEFKEEKIFNLLEVAALQMPNGTYPAISEIFGSIDDGAYSDLMPFFLGQTTQDSFGKTVIQLNANEDNPTEENIFYFFPKKLKFLRIKFVEDASYFIRTPSGLRNRTAIAIKEVKAKSQKFSQEGQFISTNFISDRELSKVAIFTDEVLPPNFDSTLKYYISIDSGRSWDEITPSQKVNNEVPGVLNYNIDFLEGSKTTELPVTSVKLKLDLELATSEDDTSINSAFTRVPKTEFQSIGAGSKTIALEQKPIGAVSIYQVNYGSVGSGNFYRVQSGQIEELDDRTIVRLPLDVFPSNSIKKDQEIIYADNFVWERVDSLSGAAASDLKYQFDYINNIITFYLDDGSGNRQGKLPANDILFKLERENPLFKNLGENYQVNTVFAHDGIKEKIKLYKLLEEELVKSIKLRNNSTIHRLGVTEIQSVSVTQDPNNKLTDEKDYINGVLELTQGGDYSVDKDKGLLYVFSEIDSDEDVRVEVTYKEREDLPFTITEGMITVESDAYKSDNKTFDITIPSSTFVVDLGIKNIAQGTVQFNTFPPELVTEVAFDEMEEKFQDDDIDSPYSIDYREGKLYSKNAISGKLVGILRAADYFIEYNLSYQIPQTAYGVNREEQLIEFADDYVLDYFADSQVSGLGTPLFKIEYAFADEVDEPASEIIQYVTPMLNEYRIITTPKDVLV